MHPSVGQYSDFLSQNFAHVDDDGLERNGYDQQNRYSSEERHAYDVPHQVRYNNYLDKEGLIGNIIIVYTF